MSWFRSGLASISISDWLTAAGPAPADPADWLEDARRAMLEALGDAGAVQRPLLAMKIRCAREADALWALRTDLMTVVSQLHGEAEGRRRLAAVTAEFGPLQPPPGALTRARGARAIQRRI